MKKKDHVDDAFNDFWASGKINTVKINSPRLKSHEDDAYDSLWGRGEYVPKPKSISVKQVHYAVPKTRNIIAEKRVQLQAMQLQHKIDLMNQAKFEQNVKIARAIATQARTGAQETYRRVQPSVSKFVKDASTSLHRFTHKPPIREEELKPVGVAGALYTARKASGKKSMYD
jgi:hypothetical protein